MLQSQDPPLPLGHCSPQPQACSWFPMPFTRSGCLCVKTGTKKHTAKSKNEQVWIVIYSQ